MLAESQRTEKIQRLKTAQKRTAESHEILCNRIGLELHPGTHMANHWGTITLSYSGLEQTLKYLLAVEGNKSIKGVREILGQDGGHNLYKPFSLLQAETQEIMKEHYERWQSLHSYIAISELDGFLRNISEALGDENSRAKGYERWRYLLIEDTDIPKNSAAAMLSIWRVAVQIAEHKEWPNQKPVTPEANICQTLIRRLEDIRLDVCVRRQNRPNGKFYNDTNDRNAWFRHYGGPLNAFAQLIWNHERRHPEAYSAASDEFAEVLQRWTEVLDEGEETFGGQDTRYFIARARGWTRTG